MDEKRKEYLMDSVEEKPEKKSKAVAGAYETDRRLNLRNGAGLDKPVLCIMEKGIKVKCDGGYTRVKESKWYYVRTTISGVTYAGFCDSSYLIRE